MKQSFWGVKNLPFNYFPAKFSGATDWVHGSCAVNFPVKFSRETEGV